jgi:ABC-2 type transport system permease protein
MSFLSQLNAIQAIAYRDASKYLKTPQRIVFSLIFPIIFIGALGGSLDANLADASGYSFIAYTTTGVFAQTIFSTVAQGIISLIQDRENNLTQELFVSPVSRYAIVIGKILGEMMVAALQGIFILLFGAFLGVSFTLTQVLGLLLAALLAGVLGGAFGIVIVSFFSDSKFINQIFPLIFFPQFFLAGVFSPIEELPIVLKVISRIIPLTYIVDFIRNIYYRDLPELDKVTINTLQFDFMIILIFIVVFMILGTKKISNIEKNG